VATEIPQRELRNDVSAILRRVAAGEEFVVTVRGEPVAELRPVHRRRTFVPTEEIFAAIAPSPGVPVADSSELDRLVEEMDFDEEPDKLDRLYGRCP
jgi:prevent-host-death family protein